MARSILLLFCAIVLSFILLTAGAWVLIQFGALGQNLSAHGSRWYEHADSFQLMGRTMLVFRFLLFPAIAAGVGVFVGALARKWVWQLAALSLSPITLFFLVGSLWSLTATILGAVYLFLASASALATARFRNRYV